jgi:translocator protein
MNFNKSIKFFSSLVICELVGFFGMIFTSPQIEGWYRNLNKPGFNPPNWIFGPVWTIIFVMMGIALYIVWDKKWQPVNKIGFENSKKINPLSRKFFSGSWQKANIILIFIFQLILNILWSFLFFAMHLPNFAFFELIMLWFSIIFMIVNFYRVSKQAALLLIPYIVWVSFAGVLNYFIWILN